MGTVSTHQHIVLHQEVALQELLTLVVVALSMEVVLLVAGKSLEFPGAMGYQTAAYGGAQKGRY